MKWNNRIIRREFADRQSDGAAGLYGLHETYYNRAGGVTMFTQEPMGGYYDTVDDLIATLEQQLSDAKKYRNDVIVEKGFVFAPEDMEEDPAPTVGDLAQVKLGNSILEEIQKSAEIAKEFQKQVQQEVEFMALNPETLSKAADALDKAEREIRDAERPAPIPQAVINQAVDESNARMENMVREERIALSEYARSLRVTQVGAPLSDKLYYAQFAGMDDAQIEAVIARAKARNLCTLICGGQAVGWIVREHVHKLPNLNALVMNQPRPIEAKCSKCQGTEWRYMGCYALDEFEAQNGFECLGCHARQYDCFDYRKRPDQSTDGAPGQAQDSGEGSQLGSPS